MDGLSDMVLSGRKKGAMFRKMDMWTDEWINESMGGMVLRFNF